MSSPPWSPRLWALLLLLSGNMLLDALEVSTIVVAMPSIGRGLGLDPPVASLAMTGFALGFGGTILLAARAVARFGRRRLYVAALVVFAIASIAGGFAVDGPMLIATRVVKGICVALTVPTGLAIIAGTFEEGPRRARAVSIYTLCGATGFSAGLLLSGAFTMAGWRWTLLFSAVVAVALLPLAIRLIPADAGARPRAAGARPPAPGGMIGGSKLVRSAAGAAVLNGSYWGFLLVATFELQERGWSPLETGLALLPSSLPLALTALVSGRLVGRFGPRRLIATGSLCALLGYVWYLAAGPARDGAGATLAGIVPAALLVGIAFMLSFSALHVQAISGVLAERQPVVSGIYQTAVQLGGAVMLLLVALGTGLAHRPALLLVTAVAAAGLATAIAGLAAGPPSTSSRPTPGSDTAAATPAATPAAPRPGAESPIEPRQPARSSPKE